MTDEEIEKDIAEGMKEVAKIRACKHNWIEDSYAHKWRTGKLYVYKCTRCNATSFTKLKD